MATNDEMVAVARTLRAVIETIDELVRMKGADGYPSGPLYAQLASFGISINVYEALVETLVLSGVIRRSNNVLYSIKPLKEVRRG